ncbi:sulfotransferase family protein [Flexibacterium corallicola]|uniref:sulfotransferase family protein n=1 Tax=Flexibacterium corallicola TaxID=3037259 RepID=UPI00286F5010|nr:sulfotransferase [Pseudovibrio sp. M1P-2-3]
MGLSIIGTGYPRTGTVSLKLALETLGVGPCYHMSEILPFPKRLAMWQNIAQGDKPDWDQVFNGYKAACDWPAALFWRELASYYPKARLILTIRDARSWYESMESTVLAILRKNLGPSFLSNDLIVKKGFNGNIENRDVIIKSYEQNIKNVQDAFSKNRLLTYSVQEGWEPLCDFLRKPVPSTPFPKANSRSDFHRFQSQLSKLPA